MTLGEKIRESRRKCGLSQEQMAEKMAVSRSAIAKWETDKGLPDVANLKILAKLLNVSVDMLLDEEEGQPLSLRESYSLADYGNGCKRIKKDRVIRERFPEATIYPLYGRPEVMERDAIAARIPDCRTGMLEDSRGPDRAFYLVEKGNRQLLVLVTDQFLEIQPIEIQSCDRFSFGGWYFIKSNYEICP